MHVVFKKDQIPIFITSNTEDDAELGLPHDSIKHRDFCTRNNIHIRSPAKEKLCDLESIKLLQKYRLKDWLISRQRKWGTPIPLILCPLCGVVPVAEDQLPILPREDSSCQCPKCKSRARYETETMDTFLDSSWYWLRFLDPQNKNELISASKTSLLPVDIYIGGVEHAVMHLLYARFMAKFLSDQNLIPKKSSEPFKKLLVQGMVKGVTYTCPTTDRYLKPDELIVHSNLQIKNLFFNGNYYF